MSVREQAVYRVRETYEADTARAMFLVFMETFVAGSAEGKKQKTTQRPLDCGRKDRTRRRCVSQLNGHVVK